jgi:[ribosomal protein S18]-alanine N-acetyltransferase
MKAPPRTLEIAPMKNEDIPRVLQIESLCFSTPWPRNAFNNELNDNKLAHYFIGRFENQIIAYSGLWVVRSNASASASIC